MKTLLLQSNGIKIRPFKESDIDYFFSHLKKSNVNSYFFPDYFLSQYKFKKQFLDTGLLEENGGYVLIVDIDENILGYIWYAKSTCFEGLLINYHQFCENKEKIVEAISIFTKYLFSSKRVNRLQVFVPNYDRRAITIARDSKFTFEGIIRQAVFDDGKYADICIYSMLREENK
jgi:[ribosomal protein S5]-alanine N-acetyltransferase